MGGAVALKAHLKDSSMWDGAVLVAPMCKIADAMYPPWYLVQIMIALAHVIPKAKLVPHTDIAEIGFRNLEKRNRVSLFTYLYRFCMLCIIDKTMGMQFVSVVVMWIISE